MLPVVTRELIVHSRRRGTYRARMGAAGAALLAMLWLMLTGSAGSGAGAAMGLMLFQSISLFAFVAAMLSGVVVTSDCLSAEKREGTLGLLFLTSLQGRDVVLGKLVSSSVVSFYGLLATVPVLALAILLGGVSLGRVSLTAVVLLNSMFFSLSAGVMVSTLSRNERKAAFATAVILALFTFYPLLALTLGVTKLPPWVAWFSAPSPLLSYLMVQNPGLVGVTVPWAIAVFIAVPHLLGWVFLGIASWTVRRVAHERPKGRKAERWAAFKRRWAYGGGEKKDRYRRMLLDQNAVFWLAARDCRKPAYVWFFLGVLSLLWLLGVWKDSSSFANWSIAVGVFWLLCGLIKVWAASEVCQPLIEDRRAGALELLLSTPLSVQEIASGHALALKRQFLRPSIFLLAFALIALIFQPRFDAQISGAMGLGLLLGAAVFVADLVAIYWVGLWVALSSRHLNRALNAVYLRVLILPWLLLVVAVSGLMLWSALVRSFNPQPWELELLWAAISIAVDLTLIARTRRKFLTQFREVASERVDLPAGTTVSVQRGGMLRAIFSRASLPRVGASWMAFARRHWLFSTLCCLFFAGALGLFFYRWHLKVRIRRELAAIFARGEPAYPVQMDRWHPPVPDAENAALQLAPLLKPNMLLLGQRAVNLSLQATQNAEILRQVTEISRLTSSRFPINWSGQGMLPYMQIQAITDLSQLLQSEAALRARAGDATGAVESIETILRLARILRREPLIMAQSSSTRCIEMAVAGAGGVLGVLPLDEPLAVRLDAAFRAAEMETLDMNRWIRSAAAERYLLIRFHESGAQGYGIWTGGGRLPSGVQVLFGAHAFFGFWDAGLLKAFPGYEQLIAALKLPFPQNFERMRSILEKQDIRAPFSPFVPYPRPQIGTATGVVSDMGLLDRIRLIRLALAVERFRLCLGRLPENLSELVPAVLDEPPEPFGSPQPFHYERREPGCLLRIGPPPFPVIRRNQRSNALPPVIEMAR